MAPLLGLRKPCAGASKAAVNENEVRPDLPPWDKGSILFECLAGALFPNLHPTARRKKVRALVRSPSRSLRT